MNYKLSLSFLFSILLIIASLSFTPSIIETSIAITFNPQRSLFESFLFKFITKRLLLLGGSIVFLIICLGYLIKSNALEFFKKTGLFLITIIIMLITVEAAFTFVSQSFNNWSSFACKNWLRQHWLPYNSFDYRGLEPDTSLAKKNIDILIVGDSFTAGQGIKDAENRFTNILDKKLPSNYSVHNLGVPGADTKTEFNNLKAYPIKPDVVILAYYINDAENIHAALKDSIRKSLDKKPNVWTNTLAKYSFLYNYFFNKMGGGYADLWKQLSQHKEFDRFFPYQEKKYLDAHLAELNQFVLYSKENQVPLYLLVFPDPGKWNLEKSHEVACKPIINFFENKGIPALDLYETIKSIPEAERSVSEFDRHPNEKVNLAVAQVLYEFLMPTFLSESFKNTIEDPKKNQHTSHKKAKKIQL